MTSAERSEKFIAMFDKMASDSIETCAQPHMVSGWTDICEEAQWDAFVADIFSVPMLHDHVSNCASVRVFEVGCGVLAFLLAARRLYSNLRLAGMDAAASAVKCVQERSESIDVDSDKFFVGLAPHDVKRVASGSHELIVANSVFQYLDDCETARLTVLEMLRICKPGGVALVADVLDIDSIAKTNKLVRSLSWFPHAIEESDSDGDDDDQSMYLHFERDWFTRNFANRCSVIEFHQVQDESYHRRRHDRFNVYMKLNC
jgi:SAM-dependent methyltransferase